MATQKSHEFRKKLIAFAIRVIKLTKFLPKTTENSVITYQITKSATSIGANYTESMFAISKAEFIHCLNICKKETGETLRWLEVLFEINPKLHKQIAPIREEAESYLKIFISSVKTSQKNNL